ncbi:MULTISPECIES: undecaprenyldiphospho-muramoylpentapeptide beta-N-acetylglucosaminyltransferase [unclassified Sedimentibacter]|uniref:undecaprenyldiphospho-muramoylpentapeptide beta-N-acetylglucosaminyltransferase n=1 Tax=unclassified Sedimentibacter TaxID=2649220 RepID=UPI0027E13CE5|nr:undecaprenyldiphospho-muramoylpentapeptide beta-N-acetylglucosaminyltransferase [Sedimentibacter sp. MB35-C1]WMJ76726.1 undecaprenyldiphospho-muramoylpentapeptide beta-N-acetylglucosaminyltransferase [Sedimentibacter sp. MB35-C1]
MRVLITGGGTGGHINPALAIAQKIKNENPSNEILYVGTKNSLESELVPKAGFEFGYVSAKYLRRKISLENIKTLFASAKGVVDSLKIINQFKPDIVVGTGGYVCGPVVLAASLKKIPTMIHEQNVFPGITNKILSKIVDVVAISFDEAEKYFPEDAVKKLVLVGNPVRKDILTADRKKSRIKLNLSTDTILIYSFGGSGGQPSLNKAIIDVIKKYNKKRGIRIIHVTGKNHYSDFMDQINEDNIDIGDNIEILDYMYDAATALSASDIVIGSAGAITIAEITVTGVPAVLIPKMYTAENHQEYNARALEKVGAAKVILEKNLNGSELIKAIEEIIENKSVLRTMSLNSKKMGNTDVENKIYESMLKLINLKSKK